MKTYVIPIKPEDNKFFENTITLIHERFRYREMSTEVLLEIRLELGALHQQMSQRNAMFEKIIKRFKIEKQSENDIIITFIGQDDDAIYVKFDVKFNDETKWWKK